VDAERRRHPQSRCDEELRDQRVAQLPDLDLEVEGAPEPLLEDLDVVAGQEAGNRRAKGAAHDEQRKESTEPSPPRLEPLSPTTLVSFLDRHSGAETIPETGKEPVAADASGAGKL
jgi:hypothetical protein